MSKILNHYDQIIREHFIEIQEIVDNLCQYYNNKGYETGHPNYIEVVTPNMILETAKEWCKDIDLGV